MSAACSMLRHRFDCLLPPFFFVPRPSHILYFSSLLLLFFLESRVVYHISFRLVRTSFFFFAFFFLVVMLGVKGLLLQKYNNLTLFFYLQPRSQGATDQRCKCLLCLLEH